MGRVVLRPAGEDVLEATGWVKERPAGELLAIEAGGGACGFIAVGRGAEASISAVWLRPEARRRGLGVDAVRLVVAGLRAEGFRSVRAFAPAEVGLFVYFWFRLGFRPEPCAASSEGLGLYRTL